MRRHVLLAISVVTMLAGCGGESDPGDSTGASRALFRLLREAFAK